jgi:hypothetical protein
MSDIPHIRFEYLDGARDSDKIRVQVTQRMDDHIRNALTAFALWSRDRTWPPQTTAEAIVEEFIAHITGRTDGS